MTGRTTQKEREQRQVDQLMIYLRPDGAPLFRTREDALAALRRLERLGQRQYRQATR